MEETKHISIPKVIKSYPPLAAAASFFLAGLGQVLCGKIKRGILILVFSLLVSTLTSITAAVLFILRSLGVWQLMYLSGLISLIGSVSGLISLFIRIWAVYDAYRIAGNLENVE